MNTDDIIRLNPRELLVHDSMPLNILCKISETLDLEPIGSRDEQVTRIEQNNPEVLLTYNYLSNTLQSKSQDSEIDWTQLLGNLLFVAEGRTYEQSILDAIYEIRTLPYYRNYAAHSGAVHAPANHEKALANIFKSNGFKEITRGSIRLPKRDIVMNQETCADSLQNIPNGSFIEQPFGTHQSPDFIVKVSRSNILFLEAKSSERQTHPTYNSGTIEPNFIYVFCSKKTNQTTIYKGDSIITMEQQFLIDQHVIEARQRDRELNDRLREMDVNHRGITYYTRPMYIQSGGHEYTDYFAHENKEQSEEHAIEWIRQQCYQNEENE